MGKENVAVGADYKMFLVCSVMSEAAASAAGFALSALWKPAVDVWERRASASHQPCNPSFLEKSIRLTSPLPIGAPAGVVGVVYALKL